MNTFNNAIADITTYYGIEFNVRDNVAKAQVPAADWKSMWKWVRQHTTNTWWTGEDDIINVYSDEYDFVMSKRSGRITITDMTVQPLERSSTPNPVFAVPYGKVDARGRVYPKPSAAATIAAYGASPANVIHALDAQRHNEMVECVKCGFTYQLYCDYMLQRVSDEYREMLTVTEREYDAAAMAFAREIANLDGGMH